MGKERAEEGQATTGHPRAGSPGTGWPSGRGVGRGPEKVAWEAPGRESKRRAESPLPSFDWVS